MIANDRRVVMGSAYIDGRSQKCDGDSEIAQVVEDDDLIESTMDGQRYTASRFAASLRRQLYKEHLGLINPQICEGSQETVTSFMRPAPHQNQNKDQTGSQEDRAVEDPLSDDTQSLWNDIRSWSAFDNYVPKILTGHVVPEVSLSRVKDRLSQVRGALVECPLDFLIDQKDFVEGPDWKGLNPTLPIYI
ncbi:hypothetical protein BDY19DRAFT_373459 [Irpex rosettiformis]|uniref:Uncharacterized protein n=1 Tax=Irpex rosettiformis TaxID=378272 RepID=A0ACB8TVG3_9APHY|nr:hypothetical protein BDY19DRAFT_373459 [Irpex rosettiformis]